MARQHLVDLAVDTEFYQAFPDFAELAATIQEVYSRYRGTAPGCSRCRADFTIIRPVIDQFFARLQAVVTQDPVTAAAIKRYLGTKQQKSFESVAIYYRATREQHHPERLTF